jgi:hypothetical protein
MSGGCYGETPREGYRNLAIDPIASGRAVFFTHACTPLE